MPTKAKSKTTKKQKNVKPTRTNKGGVKDGSNTKKN